MYSTIKTLSTKLLASTDLELPHRMSIPRALSGVGAGLAPARRGEAELFSRRPGASYQDRSFFESQRRRVGTGGGKPLPYSGIKESTVSSRTSRQLGGTVAIALMIAAFLIAPAAIADSVTADTPSFNGLDAVAKGLAIAEEADRRDLGFGDSKATLTMTLRNRHGEESTRELRNRTLEQEGDGDKSLVIFDHPRDVKGTAFLTFSHVDGDDDQWLYLPALKRVKRISSSNKSGPFMGSEFAYEDISSQEVEEYTYRFLREEAVAGQQAWVIERIPTHPKSGYKRQEVYFDQTEYRTLKVVYYDRKGDLLKTLEQSDFEQYLDQYWRPLRMSMVNHQTGKSTELIWSDFQFRNEYSDADFDRASLARAR